MLTPRDIHEAEFRRVWKGYNPEEVDEFLSQVVSAYEKIYRENEKLRAEAEELNRKLEEALKSEHLIADTLAIAKDASEELKSAAEKEAAARIQAAEAEAEHIVSVARRNVEAAVAKSEKLQRRTVELRDRMRRIVDDFFQTVSGLDGEWDHDRPVDDATQPLQAQTIRVQDHVGKSENITDTSDDEDDTDSSQDLSVAEDRAIGL